MSAASDFNGDGFDDLIIGAPRAGSNEMSPGAAYVVFGKPSGFAANFNLSTLDGSNGLRLSGVGTGELAGQSVSAAGDVNGDGFGDVIIGASAANPNGDFSAGASYVVFGASTSTVTIANASAFEGDGAMTDLTFAVTLSAESKVSTSVHYRTQNGTANSGSDYLPVEDTLLTFAPGETTKTITVEVLGDTSIEDHEQFSVHLSEANGATIESSTGSGTIVNDDTAIRISNSANSVEGDAATTPVVFTVSLEKASALPVTVNYTTIDGTAFAGSDFTGSAPDSQITFSPGEITKTITVDIIGDANVENDENFSVVLSGATNAALVVPAAMESILNDDTTLRISDVSAPEGDSGTTPFSFLVNLEKASVLPVTVNYGTLNGSAVAGSDFAASAPGSQITFSPGEITKTVTLDIIGDTTVEAHETFVVVLSGATNATIADEVGSGTILNDETVLRINDASVLEGHAASRAVTFTVSLSAQTTLPVSVNFATNDGTGSAGADYTALTPGTLNFAPGETSKTITVDVLGDTVVEASETFSVVLSGVTNAAIDDAIGVGTILDDDVTLVGKREASFTDIDGDLVAIKVSKGKLKVEDFTIVPADVGAQLALIDFSGEPEFAGANLSVLAKRAHGTNGGDHLVNVGQINLAGIDFGNVVVKGDLGRIDVGNDLDSHPGLLSLRANSLGARGLDTQLPDGSLQSEIAGAFKTLKLGDGVRNAVLSVSGDVGTVAIKGSVLGGALRSDGKIGSLKIGGDFAGSATDVALITARGSPSPLSPAKAFAIHNLSIGGSVDHAQILAGYDSGGLGVNTNVAIGTVLVGGDWIASDLVAGATAGVDRFFGTEDDALISFDNPLIAKIASIVIRGTATGTPGGTDHFGFVAEEIGSFKSGGIKLGLIHGMGNDLAGVPVGSTGDLEVREAASPHVLS